MSQTARDLVQSRNDAQVSPQTLRELAAILIGRDCRSETAGC